MNVEASEASTRNAARGGAHGVGARPSVGERAVDRAQQAVAKLLGVADRVLCGPQAGLPLPAAVCGAVRAGDRECPGNIREVGFPGVCDGAPHQAVAHRAGVGKRLGKRLAIFLLRLAPDAVRRAGENGERAVTCGVDEERRRESQALGRADVSSIDGDDFSRVVGDGALDAPAGKRREIRLGGEVAGALGVIAREAVLRVGCGASKAVDDPVAALALRVDAHLVARVAAEDVAILDDRHAQPASGGGDGGGAACYATARDDETKGACFRHGFASPGNSRTAAANTSPRSP